VVDDALIRDLASKKAHERAVTEWMLPVRRSKDEGVERIDHYIRGDDALAWGYLKGEFPKYDRDSNFMWCGAFAAYCWGFLKKQIRKQDFASTNRLFDWSEDTDRRIEPMTDAVPGDVFIVGPKPGMIVNGKSVYRKGRHLGIVDSVDLEEGGINTIEGNTIGMMPDGKEHSGVGKDFRPFYREDMDDDEWRVLWIIRPLTEDLQEDALLELTKEAESMSGVKGIVEKARKHLYIVGAAALGAAALGAGGWFFVRGGKKRRSKKKR